MSKEWIDLRKQLSPKRENKKNLFKNFIKITFATSFIYLFGMIWLGFLIGWEKPIFKLGAEPFLLAELFKILMITLLMSKIKKIRKFI